MAISHYYRNIRSGGFVRGASACKRLKKARVLQLGIEMDSEDVPVVHEYRKKEILAKAAAEPAALKYEPARQVPNRKTETRIKKSFAERWKQRNNDEKGNHREDVMEELRKRRIGREVAMAQFKKEPLQKKDTGIYVQQKERKPKKENHIVKEKEELFLRPPKPAFSLQNLAFLDFSLKRSAFSFAIASLAVAFFVGTAVFVEKGIGIKGKVLGVSDEAYSDLTSAVESISRQDFELSEKRFNDAYEKFSQASADIDDLGSVFVETSRFVPFASKLSSGKYGVEAAKHISRAGQELNVLVKSMSSIKNPIGSDESSDVSLLETLAVIQERGIVARDELVEAQNDFDKINIDDIPEDKQEKFARIKESLPEITGMMGVFIDNSHIIADLLGANGPRKYLFLFQNNNEMRPTGGFIGSYGLLDVSQGRVRNFFIDGIFNPDGQLIEKIVPPKPIQKMSAAWSLHDSNWWPDFPTSAKEAIKFYEKTGGPTADGIITFTPTVMQKLLEITGPIEMPQYDVTLDSNNFIEKTQYEVEVDYDKEENKPKKILSDLAPIVLDRLLSTKDVKTVAGAAEVFSEALSQKHILIYSSNENLQKIISQQGWSGEILNTSKDYLSVINTNINGYKTDGVIDEEINHSAEIQTDGSIVDTVVITRKHKGGNTAFEWWNKVNADYMRVYVPKGSTLLEVSGQTREFTEPPLDYDALGFKHNPLVEREESSMSVDTEAGTRIYEESGKTVFANWAYVSPQEAVTVTYRYRLPFKLFQVSAGKGTQLDSYSLVAQKQSGSLGSSLITSVLYPDTYELKWRTPEGKSPVNGKITNEAKLDVDQFFGYVFEKE